MNYYKYFLLLIFTLMLGCTEEMIQNDLEAPEEKALNTELILSPLYNYTTTERQVNFKPQLRGNAVTKTLKSESAGTLSFFPFSSECSDNIQVVIEGEGLATHLGLFTIRLTYCTDGENLLGPIAGTQTAANGDMLFTVLVGAGFDPELGAFQDYIYYDGTGRFDGVTGETRLYGVVDYVNLVFSNHGVGTITY